MWCRCLEPSAAATWSRIWHRLTSSSRGVILSALIRLCPRASPPGPDTRKRLWRRWTSRKQSPSSRLLLTRRGLCPTANSLDSAFRIFLLSFPCIRIFPPSFTICRSPFLLRSPRMKLRVLLATLLCAFALLPLSAIKASDETAQEQTHATLTPAGQNAIAETEDKANAPLYGYTSASSS